jgi:hypothetical protein
MRQLLPDVKRAEIGRPPIEAIGHVRKCDASIDSR